MRKIGIIGGGASGLMVACQLKNRAEEKGINLEITILEKMSSCAKKLLLTGHGRCNITNKKAPEELCKAYFEAGKFMSSCIKNYTSEQTMEFVCNTLGVPLKEEDDNRIFPQSDSAKDIKDGLLNYLDEGEFKVNIITGFECIDIMKNTNSAFKLRVFSKEKMSMDFDIVIMATGGQSFPNTGSDGKGYNILRKIGHTIMPLRAGLAAITVSKKDREFTSSVAGVSVDAKAMIYYQNKKKKDSRGNVLFTHEGLSGPVIMELSREIPTDMNEDNGWVELDFIPDDDDMEVDRKILDKINNKPKSKITNLLSEYMPLSLSTAIVKRAEITDITSGKINKAARKSLLNEIKHLRFKIQKAPSCKNAYVTVGGVSLKEINRKNFKSKMCDNLYVIGELLDVDGKSGGYNLQACMSEAAAVAKDIIDGEAIIGDCFS